MLDAPVTILREKQAFFDGFLVLFRGVVNVLANRAFELNQVILAHICIISGSFCALKYGLLYHGARISASPLSWYNSVVMEDHEFC